ncbi:LamG domain-containing protein [Bacteroidota bacterium]
MRILIILLVLLTPSIISGQENKAIMHWGFEEIENRNLIESDGSIKDSIEGNFEQAPGIKGKGLRFDGFTTSVIRDSKDKLSPGNEFTVEAWIALGSYPWNWCPVFTTESNETKGFRLSVGPLGQASFECAINEQWIVCTSEIETLDLRKWTHIAGVFTANKEMSLYINGNLIATCEVKGSMNHSRSECRIGMVSVPEKPSDIHRTWGTIAAYYGIDGIIDEVSVYKRAKSSDDVLSEFNSFSISEADIKARKLPELDKHPKRFGAYYTKLKYYPGWDNLWPVEQDPDIVVCFKNSDVKLVFWRGVRYAASWITENNKWMTDQSVEAWEHGDKDREGCFEHMQDRHCRFSHVRIIENNDARVVVHWRYAPVSAYDNTWHPDSKTGWECWIDEYYYIYPDATAIRKVSWKKGSLGYPRQFQESLALMGPGDIVSDIVEQDYVYVADYDNNKNKSSYLEDPSSSPYGAMARKAYTIQRYNFKSENKPFICFEPGNMMSLRNSPLTSYNGLSGCNHFPVGQARCDGRTTRVADRVSHFNGFPISDPVVNEKADRYYWCGLYGMNNMNMDHIEEFGRSWAYSPELILKSSDFQSNGYDRSQRCFQIENTGEKEKKMEFTIQGTKDKPIINPAFYIKKWNSKTATVHVNGKKLTNCLTGFNNELHGTDLVVYIQIDINKPLTITITP